MPIITIIKKLKRNIVSNIIPNMNIPNNLANRNFDIGNSLNEMIQYVTKVKVNISPASFNNSVPEFK